ncbi:MAG: hypothetical protein CMC79_05435 [Flavobacteriaceae bacterium]|nr:hypothetical protein [Flavobacteriaceae bacterium]|tara:strand:- start:5529 stop:6188 length:660 start_codon:yes stop_codon:yes gene_type:complete
MKKKFCYFLFLFTKLCLAQNEQTENPLFITHEDSVPNSAINLKEVIVYQPLTFKSYDAAREYAILRRRTFKVYPYAKLAADRLQILNERLSSIKSKRDKRKYLKRLEKFIYNEFEEELKKLSRSQGLILIKLIHRQTGDTTHELIKDLRNGLRAIIYQTTASFFKLSLKAKYDPENNYNDYLIEDILLRAFAAGHLKEQPTALNYDLDKLYYLWKEKRK